MAKVTPSNQNPGAPVEAPKKPRKQAVKREFHPLLNPQPAKTKKGKDVIKTTAKLDAIPADYDPKKHKPLARLNFTDETLWYELKAQELDKKAAALRQQVVDAKALGALKGSKSAKKVLTLNKRIEDLFGSLKADNASPEMVEAALQRLIARLLPKSTDTPANEVPAQTV